MGKVRINVVISVTKKEYEAISFFRSEVSDKVSGSSDEAYAESIEVYTTHYSEFVGRLFASKSKTIQVFEHELDSFRELRHETAGKIDGGADDDYIADFERHDKQLTKLRKKFNKAKSKATVAWALDQARKRGLDKLL